MGYLYKAIRLIKNNSIAYFLFILMLFIPFVFEAIRYIHDIKALPYLLLILVVDAAILFFDTGIYYLFLQDFGNERKIIFELYQSSKKYFMRTLAVSICMGIVFLILFYISSLFFKKILLTNISAGLYQRMQSANIVRNIVSFFVLGFFIYALPSVYVNNSKVMRSLQISYTFLKANFKRSLPLIYLCAISFVTNSILTQFACNYEYSAVAYWLIMFANNICTYTLNLLVFLMAALILKDSDNC